MKRHRRKASGTQGTARRLQSSQLVIGVVAALINLVRLLKDGFY